MMRYINMRFTYLLTNFVTDHFSGQVRAIGARRIEYIMAGGLTGQSNSSIGCGYDRLPS